MQFTLPLAALTVVTLLSVCAKASTTPGSIPSVMPMSAPMATTGV